MKVVITGSKDKFSLDGLRRGIADSEFKITEIYVGDCWGMDKVALHWAKDNHIPVTVFRLSSYAFPTDKDVTAALRRRNAEMLDNADAVLLLWDRKSPGTGLMRQMAYQKGLLTHVYDIQ